MKNREKRPQKSQKPQTYKKSRKSAPAFTAKETRAPDHKQAKKPEKKPKEKRPAVKKAVTNRIDFYGVHAISEAWTNPKRHIHALYITQAALDGFDETLKAAQAMGLKRPQPVLVQRTDLDAVLPQGSVHQGIGLSCQPLNDIDLDDILRGEEQKDRSVLVMLDQVTDPHNVGAVIRSACAFGAGGMILQKKHAPDLTGALAKTACGGVEHLPVAYEINLTRTLESLQSAGYTVVGFSEHAEDGMKRLSDFPKLVLVLGAEGEGLRRLVREQCDLLVRLPTIPPIASLNVSNAAAVALYAALGE